MTIDCGQKQELIRKYVRAVSDENLWIGFNSREMNWEWESSKSSGLSFVNFRRAKWPELKNCVYMDHSKARTWRGSSCRKPRGFICEKNNIYPEYDVNSYTVNADISENGGTDVLIDTVFESRSSSNESFKDIPFTIVVPKNAVITEFSMKMAGQRIEALIEECVRCSEDFIKSTHSGNITSKLIRSKFIEENQFRVLTVINFKLKKLPSINFQQIIFSSLIAFLLLFSFFIEFRCFYLLLFNGKILTKFYNNLITYES